MPTANKSNCHPTQPDIWATQVESRPSQSHRVARLVEACNQCKSISGAAYLKLCHMHWHWGCCHRAATAAALCHIRILYALASIQGSQPIQPASQPFRRPSVHPAVCLSIQTVSRCSCQRSILQFIIIVIDSFEWLQWQTGLPSVDRGKESEREHLSGLWLHCFRFIWACKIYAHQTWQIARNSEISNRFQCLKINRNSV